MSSTLCLAIRLKSKQNFNLGSIGCWDGQSSKDCLEILVVDHKVSIPCRRSILSECKGVEGVGLCFN